MHHHSGCPITNDRSGETVNGGGAALRQLRLALLVVALLACVAVYYYAEIEGWPLLDALFMVAITTSTVGYGEVHPLTPGARAFSLFFIVAGVLALAWAARAGGEFVVQASVSGALARRRLLKMIKGMRNHYIVCGHGRMGREIVRELRSHGQSVVVIESGEAANHTSQAPEALHVRGDATEDQVLLEAGVERASGLVAVTSTDEDNVFIVLSARALNGDLFIVARCDSMEAEGKLLRAGADRVISPYLIGGRRIAHALLRPNLTDFLDSVDFMETRAENGEPKLHMCDIRIAPNCHLDGRTIHHADIHERCGAVIIGVRKREGHLHLGAPKHVEVNEGDVIIAMGTKRQVADLQALATCEDGG
jgi:voltage-gated potassium channel